MSDVGITPPVRLVASPPVPHPARRLRPSSPTLSDPDIQRLKAQAKAKFVTLLAQAITNVEKISGMVTPEIREGVSGRGIKIEASATALQANLAIIDRAMGKITERHEGQVVTVPIQIVMSGGRAVDIRPGPVEIEVAP